ncbi:MAG: 4-hydroxythreonine-4-phosphate dehydrogenase PdxA [Bacteroidaceae bacterium]|nr:4-hydroxythreonine-4-phosphate dehydrogenase PdxA [Bacteroidaceae bacterium]MBR1755336.1 4-hydroxythreonine-4-phosphate dehydrogenase PdxA [Bacteroidaceae bacterium]
MKIRVGITHGDTNGVGYEIIFKAFEDPAMLELCTPIVYGSPKVASYHRKGMELTTNFTSIDSATEANENALNILHCTADEVKVELGQGTAESGAAALAALERALKDWREGLIDVLVTAPINKHAIQSETFHFPGHTEYIQDRVGGEGQQALMILMNDRIRIALATTHVPVSEIAKAITQEGILQKLRILNHSLQRDFSVSTPRIAVLALNPHAGDDGLLGKEEEEIIRPAMQQAEEEGMNLYGPFAADGFFGTRAYESFDAVLAMYHDQGLAPFKLLAMDDGVNYTAGLDIVRTSPDHGTAYDIAGKGVANENSLRQAIFAATDIFRNRQAWDEARQNPLPKLYIDKRDRAERG